MLYKIFNIPNTIISRYLLKNLIIFLLSIFFIVGLIVFGNQFVLTVQESVEHGIPFQELMPIVGFNMLRDIPVIFSLSLFLAIIISISQMYKSSEAVVMNSFGMGDKAFIYYIQPIVIFSFIVVFFLTIYAVPWAKQQKSYAEDETVNASEFSFITEGKFENFKNGEIIFYASESSGIDNAGEQNMEEVFIYVSSKESPVIVLASEATKYTDSKNQSIYLRLKDGVRYEGLPGNLNVNILDFDQYDLEIVSGEVQKSLSNFSEVEEKTSINLLTDDSLLANAEMQWRFSQPISILILSIIGVLLGKASPRNGKGINLLIGVLIFMIYNNGLLVAKTSIENGELNPMVGLWSVHLLFILFFLFLYHLREGKLLYFIDKILILFKPEKKNV
ncbi:LPS export ABC transporter permease LptF [Candidatus Pseudothioglobus singularis]|jgi:lipopolysaccharide export system permease protein|uniref:Lipopolysaccharide export system permease protein LptF n=1 Tax=Candidatus Pseudothioglobus singularis PS1 TaxID=1125411 RepID=A0A0M3T1X9_9GAMM|nr:LPS export ABC transporter permease LptF [Candidatus Pseudothioglobus singularis]ALE01785.1 permease [Candidatus Pseudothioglobus singularis PS1]